MELCVTKTPGGFIPVREEDQEFYQSAGAGEIWLGKVKRLKPRNARFFRKWWALVDFAFEHWEPEVKTTRYGVPEKNRERFRKDLTVLAGFYETTFKINGDVVLQPKSIAWHKMDEEEFRQLYSATFNAVAKHIFSHYTPEQLREVERALVNFC